MDVLRAIEILEIDSTKINEPEVKQAYRNLIKIWHPDKHVGKESKQIALGKSANLNNAFETLTEYIEITGDIILSKFNKDKKVFHDVQHNYGHDHFTPGFPDETVFEHFLKSSHILSAEYNNFTRKLYIKFKNNYVYEYTGVSVEKFEGLLDAEAPGRFANKYTDRLYIGDVKNPTNLLMG